jgi:TolA-binding protein
MLNLLLLNWEVNSMQTSRFIFDLQLRLLARSLAIVLCALLVMPSHVFAKAKKQTGDSGVEEQLKFKVGDESGNEVKALKTELLVINSEKRALGQLLALEKKYQGKSLEPEIIYHLADLYMHRARSQRFFEIHRNSDQIMTFIPQQVKGETEASEIRKAIAKYEEMQLKFPEFRYADIVIFNDAYAHQQLGEDQEAERLLAKLIKTQSDSPLVADAYLAVGEINFAHRNFKVALENFKAIKKFPQSRVYPYGLYKAAWTYYNLQDAASGLKQLEEAVAFGREVAKNDMDSKLDLRKEALGDMALFYGDVKPANEAVDYFRDQAQELDAVTYLLKLVELYNHHSRYADIDVILKDVLLKFPQSPSVAGVHEELIWNSERMRNRAQASVLLANFDQWCDAKPKVKAVKPVAEIDCRAKIAEVSKKLATKWHATWKKQGGPDDLAASAEKGYRLYLKNIDAGNIELADVRFSYAELLFARAKYREASDNYASIEDYRIKGVTLKPKVGHDAAYAAILSLEKATADKWSDVDEKRFVYLSDIYVKHYPQGQYVLDLQFKRAFIAYEKERYDEAAPLLKKIGWTGTKATGAVSEKVSKAQDLYLDILNIKKDYRGLKEAAQALLTVGTEGTRTTQIEKIYREAYFSEIQALEEKGELAKAVDSYKKFALENTSSELASKAWWNASQLQFRMGDAEGGANTCYQMHKLFPSSSNGRDCLTKAAQTFENIARLDLAARVILHLAVVEMDKQDHWREVAADFFALSGNKERAIAMYLKLAESKKDKEQLALYEKALVLARDTGDQKTVALLETKYVQAGVEPHVSRIAVEQAEHALAVGDMSRAFNDAKHLIGKDGVPKNMAARARLVQAQVLDDEFRRQSVKAHAERMGLVLSIKTEKLEKAQKAYQSVILYGDAETSTKALHHLADCYLDYAKTVKTMELPEGTAENDRQAFKAEIDQLVIPMEEKGIETMSQALESAKKAQLRDGQIAELQIEMSRLNMKTTVRPAITIHEPTIYLPQFPSSLRSQVGL